MCFALFFMLLIPIDYFFTLSKNLMSVFGLKQVSSNRHRSYETSLRLEGVGHKVAEVTSPT